ncbi:uncharacterized protein [Amphiura filiformis]|uniref:uncharacterized protein n=1 Tax=Amphiura filiformis TaxID=82378 RepID=UPI003B21911D
MVELEPDNETSQQMMKGDRSSQRVMLQCTDHDIIKDGQLQSISGAHPEQVLDKDNKEDTTELAIGAAVSKPLVWKIQTHSNNLAVVINVKSATEENTGIKLSKVQHVGKSVKDDENKVRKCEDEAESKVDFQNNSDNKAEDNCETEKNNNDDLKETAKNKKDLKNTGSDRDDYEKEKHEEKHEEETLEKTDKQKEKKITKCRKRKRRKRRKMVNSGETAEQPKEKMEVPGIVSATGGKNGGVKSSSNNQTNTTTSSRRQSGKRRSTGADGIGGSPGGCGGKPPTPPHDWKEKAPDDGEVEIKKQGRRPSKRLITRQDSHTSLPSTIRHGAPYVLNRSPENQSCSLPPIGVLPASDLVIENFVQPAFQHIQAQPSFVHWRTHHCQPCKTMQACLYHLRGCTGHLMCDTCRKMFDEVNRHVGVCQRSDDDMCGMAFCKEFYDATTQGKEAQFAILAKFAASFYDAELNTPKPLHYPVQRQQSVTDVPMSRKPTIGGGTVDRAVDPALLDHFVLAWFRQDLSASPHGATA